MEKFAVDLDRVLDEFEFNEDCAEQVASSADSENSWVPSSVEPGSESSSKMMESRRRKLNETSDIGKIGRERENSDSINDFYTRGRTLDDKVQQKRYVDFGDREPVALTIHNDVSRKLVQKRQNESSSSATAAATSAKNHNSYDKKLNQPNIRPSVSNVFSSLNDYINAPSGNVEATATTTASESEIKIIGKMDTILGEESVIPESREIRYRNILLPAKLDSNIGEAAGSSGEVPMTDRTIGESLEVSVDTGKSVMPIKSRSTTSEPRLPSGLKKIGTDEQTTVKDHDYENIDIRTRTNDDTELTKKVVYENVNLDGIIGEKEGKNSSAYERICAAETGAPLETMHGDTERSGPIVNRAISSTFQNAKLDTTTTTMTSTITTTTATITTTTTTTTKEKEFAVGFNTTIDDLSEDELKKYLAELEAEERANEAKLMYENVVPAYDPPRKREITSRKLADDEDANEAPIFETVTIGVLPTVSEEKLQEKAKKFPVIDYGKQQGSSCSSIEPKTGDFFDKRSSRSTSSRVTTISGITEEAGHDSDNEMAKSSDDINESSTVNSESIESELAVIDTTERTMATRQFADNIWPNHDGSRIPVNNDSPKDFASKKIEFEGNNADNDNVEFEGNGVPEAPISNYGEPERIAEASRNIETAVLKEDNTDSTHDDRCLNDENNEISEFPTSVEDITGDSEESARDEGNEDKPSRPQTLDIVSTLVTDDGFPDATPENQERSEAEVDPQRLLDSREDVSDKRCSESSTVLGKQPPFWIPDNEAPNCMLCDVRFTVIKRRHHCRACGKVLCNKCCGMKYRLEYQGNIDSRVCSPCYQLLVKAEREHQSGDCSSTCANGSSNDINSSQGRQPNPNNPMEYCSTIPPLQQLAGGLPPPPTVMVPVGVLKREGSSKQRPEGQKSVMFSDGIRPGCDLTELDTSWDPKPPYRKMGKRTAPTSSCGQNPTLGPGKRQNTPPMDPNTECYVPQDPDLLPPTVTIHKGEITYHETTNPASLYKSLKNECEPPIMFAINRNLYAYVKITNLNCCVNRICWNVTSRGLACVGQDEVVLLVETLPDETQIPKDLLVHINQIYIEAIKGNTITELGVSLHQGGHFLGSREHAGFLFIRQTFQCLQKIILPPAPFLFGLLVHRWETPWAKVFPLRLMLRLGAEYRYYPCPLVSVRFRDAVYFEIGHTIMKVLADFRNFAYTLPGVRGMTIHMQDRRTDVLLPKNRYDQVIKGLNNSNDHVLAFASNFSVHSDSHLVCIQTNTGDESTYQTQAINIHNKPRKVTGASFVVINGALKSSMGLSAKSSIVEDGLMVQIMPEKMEALKASLKNMQDFSIGCGLQGAPEPDETVNVKWVDNDQQFNLGVKSPIDGKAMDGVPSIRVHNGTDYTGTSRFIRWTEVFIIKSDDHPAGVHDPVDINKLSESIARATCAAFVKLLDLLATAGLTKLAVRTTIHPDNVGYEAGSEGTRLPPIYMNSLDNELVQVLHKAAQTSQDTNTVLELIFHVLDD